ncbi:MAG TPA: molybdopterin dinucleotide binding domain-containing protein [Candidatus Bathyarchaeia archaeon]|nr:molybdopterin dinucleotide binding domain-containing protein [Candidatus Bathyarchaeia archaeon]
MPSLKVTLLTGRTLRQGQGKEYGKLSERYRKSVATCEIDPEDLKKLSIKDGTTVKVTTSYGSVAVRAIKSLRGPHPGSVFVPYGPWASVIVGSKTHGTGMPSFKGIEAVVEPADDDSRVLTLQELLLTHYGKK